jgi:hypothetical protein
VATTDHCTVQEQLIADLESLNMRIMRLRKRQLAVLFKGNDAAEAALTAVLSQIQAEREVAVRALRDHCAEHRCNG